MRRLKKDLWPHCVTLTVDDTRPKIDRIELWLADNVGVFRSGWNAVYHYNCTDFYFKLGKDATLFALKWSDQ